MNEKEGHLLLVVRHIASGQVLETELFSVSDWKKSRLSHGLAEGCGKFLMSDLL
jgi:hypothetical protein